MNENSMTKQEALEHVINLVKKVIASRSKIRGNGGTYNFNFEGMTEKEIIKELHIITTEAYHDGVLSFQDEYSLQYSISEYGFLF